MKAILGIWRSLVRAWLRVFLGQVNVYGAVYKLRLVGWWWVVMYRPRGSGQAAIQHGRASTQKEAQRTAARVTMEAYV